MVKKIDKGNALPIYLRLKQILEKQIEDKAFGIDGKLPAERELANKYEISRIIVRKTLKLLANDKKIVKIRGKGTFVNPDWTNGKTDSNLELTAIGFLFIGSDSIESGSNTFDILNGAVHNATVDKVNLLTLCLDSISESPDELPLAIINREIKGVIINGSWIGHEKMILKIAEIIPTIFTGNYIYNLPISAVIPDNIAGTRSAIKYLYDLGHRSIGYVIAGKQKAIYRERFQGYRIGLDDVDLEYNDELTFFLQPEEMKSSIIEKVLKSRSRPTALICDNDMIASLIITIAQKNNLKVPDDLSVIGFDNTSGIVTAENSLTTIKVPRFEIGQIAYNTLINMILKKQVPVRVVAPVELIIRKSCCKPKDHCSL